MKAMGDTTCFRSGRAVIKKGREGWGCGSVAWCLPSLYKALGSIPSTEKKKSNKKNTKVEPGEAVHFFSPSTWVVNARGWSLQSQPGLHTEFKVSPHYTVGSCLQRKGRKEGGREKKKRKREKGRREGKEKKREKGRREGGRGKKEKERGGEKEGRKARGK
jgi:hypothetical protein